MKKLFSGILFIGVLLAVGNAFGYEPDVSPIEKSCLSVSDCDLDTNVVVYSMTPCEFEATSFIVTDINYGANEFAVLPSLYTGEKNYHTFRHTNDWLLHKNLLDKPGTLTFFDCARDKLSCIC